MESKHDQRNRADEAWDDLRWREPARLAKLSRSRRGEALLSLVFTHSGTQNFENFLTLH
jgi:hypothetical protein